MAGLLIVDDEIECCQEIRLIIEDSQYSYLSIYEADTAHRGLSLAKQIQPNIIIFDLSLPEMEGLLFGKKVLEISPHSSIIVLTHLKMFEMVQAAVNLGFSGYLLKPASKTELLSLFDRLLSPKLINDTNFLRETASSSSTYEMDLTNPIQSVVNYIHNRFYEPISLNEVADQAYLSPSHFSRLFKAEIGVTFIEYLTKYRVEQSKKMLKMTSLPVEVIANNTGFANASYFATTFKRLEGKTPSEYRNLFANFLKQDLRFGDKRSL